MSGRAVLAGVPIGEGAPVAVMGALNVSPESFYAGSIHLQADALLRAALAMEEQGAQIIDVGARSTAPYRTAEIGEAEETLRLARAVEALAGKLRVPISADTPRVAPARAALAAGARIVNDVLGLADPALVEAVLAAGADVIAMAAPGPTSLGLPPADAVRARLAAVLDRARHAGLQAERIVLDPGIGFFRDEHVPWDEWDAAVLAGLGRIASLGRPLCLGVSRKSFIGAITGRTDPGERLAGSLAATAIAVLNGAALIRTHDVAPTLDAVRVAERLARESA